MGNEQNRTDFFISRNFILRTRYGSLNASVCVTEDENKLKFLNQDRHAQSTYNAARRMGFSVFSLVSWLENT